MENDSVDNLQKAESSFKDMYSKLYGVPREDLEDVSIDELEQFETAFKKRANKVQFKKIEPVNVALRKDEAGAKEVINPPLADTPQAPVSKEPAESELNITTSSAAKSIPLSTDINNNTSTSITENSKPEQPVKPVEPNKPEVIREKTIEKIVEPVKEPVKEAVEVKPEQITKQAEKPIEQQNNPQVVVEPKKLDVPDITDLDKRLKMETAHLAEPPSIVEEPVKKEPLKIAEDNKPAQKNIDKMVDNLLEHPMHKAFEEPSKSLPVTDQTVQPKPEISQANNLTLPASESNTVAPEQPVLPGNEPKAATSLPLNANLKNGEIDVIQAMIDNFKNLSGLKKELPTQPSAGTSQGLAGQANETGAVTSNIFNVSQQPTLPGLASKFNIPITQAPAEITSPSEQTLKAINTNLDAVVKSITTVLKEIRVSMEGVKGTVDQIAAMIPGIQGGSTINTQLAGKSNGANTINSGMINNYKNEIRNQTGSNIIDIKNTRGSYPGFTI